MAVMAGGPWESGLFQCVLEASWDLGPCSGSWSQHSERKPSDTFGLTEASSLDLVGAEKPVPPHGATPRKAEAGGNFQKVPWKKVEGSRKLGVVEDQRRLGTAAPGDSLHPEPESCSELAACISGPGLKEGTF